MSEHEAIEILNIFGKRYAVLRLLEEDDYTQQELSNNVRLSQSTVSRVLSTLQENGIIKQTNGEYAFTFLGEQLFEIYHEVLCSAEQYYNAKDVLGDLPADYPLDPFIFNEAELVISKPNVPDSALSALQELAERATRIRSISSMYITSHDWKFPNKVFEKEVEYELIASGELIDEARKRYRDKNIDPLKQENFTRYKLESCPPYNFYLIDTHDGSYVCVLISTDSLMNMLIINPSEAAYERAEEEYLEYRSQASRG